jgi:hypothetical protein
MNTNIIYLCTGCNKIYNTLKSLDSHHLSCIYYNYNNVSSNNYINNEYIYYIIKILFEIENYNMTDDNFIKIKDILSNDIFKSSNIKCQNIYNTINKMKIDYISYNQLMHVITLSFAIRSDEFNLLIKCYNKCKKYIH